jgi:hypothetical protein
MVSGDGWVPSFFVPCGDSVPGVRCQVSGKRNIEAEIRTLNTETCIRTETLALVICDLEFLFLQYFSTPGELAFFTCIAIEL